MELNLRAYIPPDMLEELKKISLFTYLNTVYPNELISEGGGLYCTRTHDSLKISNGLWNWFSRGIGGKNAIDFLIEDRHYEYIEAANFLAYEMNIRRDNYMQYVPMEQSKAIKKVEKQIVLPERNETNKRVFAYLNSRGIDKEIINYCIDNNYIYEEKEHHNVVFLGYDENKKVKFGCARATNSSRFMIDLKGSSKEYSFRLLSNERSTAIHLFESAIDLLSYATLIKNRGMDFRKFNLISLSGVYQTAKKIEDSKVPVALKKYLEFNKDIRTIILHLDNDLAGRNATEALTITLKNDYEIKDKPSSYGKDVNDFLVHQIELKNKERSDFSR